MRQRLSEEIAKLAPQTPAEEKTDIQLAMSVFANPNSPVIMRMAEKNGRIYVRAQRTEMRWIMHDAVTCERLPALEALPGEDVVVTIIAKCSCVPVPVFEMKDVLIDTSMKTGWFSSIMRLCQRFMKGGDEGSVF